jgi:hypothetical protein
MVRARKKLATQLKSKPPVESKDMSDTVPNFFEDLGTAYKAGCVDKRLATSSFSIFVTRYWEALKPSVDEERRQYGGDVSISEDFEYLAKEIRQTGEKIDEHDLQQFLEDESRATTD